MDKEYLLRINGGEIYTINKNINVIFYDEKRNPIGSDKIIINKNKDKASFKIPKLSGFISIHVIN